MNANERENGKGKGGGRHSRPIGVHWRSFAVGCGDGVLFLVLSLTAICIFLTLFSPKPYTAPLEAVRDYDLGPMLAAVAPDAVRERLDEVADLGNRFLGSEGFYDCEALIRQRYSEAGLRLFEQSIRTTGPQTDFAEALDEDGTPASFNIYPFMPNHYQPVATPEDGIAATVLRIDESVLRSRPSFEGCFALLDASAPPPIEYGYHYSKYAQLGFEGVIVSHPEGLQEVPWASCLYMVTLNPVNFPRVAADPSVFDYVGRRIVLRAKVSYRGIPNRTLVGVLSGEEASDQAVVIPCSYDALSMLPDRSPGLVQALPVAIQLQLLGGLQSYRGGLRRDVIFVAFGGHVMADDAQDRLMSVVGARPQQQGRLAHLKTRHAANATQLRAIDASIGALAAADVMTEPEATEQALAALDPTSRSLLEEQIQYVLDTLVFELSETVLQTRITFEKGDTSRTDGPEFLAFQAAKSEYDKAFSSAGLGPVRLLESQAAYAVDVDLHGRLVARLAELKAYHQERATFLEQSLRLNELFSSYDRLIVFAPQLVATEGDGTEQETLTFSMGNGVDHSNGGQAAYDAILGAIQQLDLGDRVRLRFEASARYGDRVHSRMTKMPLESRIWARAGYPAYSVVHSDRSYAKFAHPAELPEMRNTASVAASLKVFGAAMVSLGHGNGSFTPLKFRSSEFRDYRGNVYVANVGQSIIPNYPLAGALVGNKAAGHGVIAAPGAGMFTAVLDMTDPYGRYERNNCLAAFAGNVWAYGPEAIGFDDRGVISLIKDEGPKAQRIYVSMNLRPEGMAADVNIITFRAAPVTVLDLINPQSLKSYAGARFIRRRGLNEFSMTYSVSPNVVGGEGILTTFVPPDEYFYVELKAGAADNDLVQTTRAFMLGVDPEAGRKTDNLNARPGSEIRGRGYLAAETPLIWDVPTETARSMIAVNDQRLAVQDHYGMADARTRDFQSRAGKRLDEAADPTIPRKRAALSSRDAVTYSTLNHPILRRNIFEAVAGILWYLGLLVPFTFFFEKLVFGYPDVRKQLGAHVGIFLVAFALLKWLHPAFAMIRSSLMILLGFIILLISTGILAMFSSKFKENLESIKQQRGQVTAAEVNKFGAVVTAFMLGLNNMHRRRVRTMLTCGTLVLITFVMICFTSVQSDIVDSSVSVGKAPFQGFVVKNEEYRPVSASELFALQTKYGEQYKVAARRAAVGTEDWTTRRRNYPEFELVRSDGERTRSAEAMTMLTWSPDEPLAKLLVPPERWFVEEDAQGDPDDPVPVLLSEVIAGKLGIRTEMLDGDTPVEIEISGAPCTVRGIFDGKALDAMLDFDGYNLLPFDIKALREVNKAAGSIIADVEDPRISGDDAIIAPRGLGVTIANSSDRILSVAVALPEALPPKQVREEIEQFMEQSGRLTYFGLDGYAFLGKRARESTFVGLVDMLIPLIIAAITVLNTIRGSVYERKEEIFVYNAVGIAPRHIFFMFFAEAFVYAVVGSVLGYILSQGTGKLLTAVNLTGGLNMTFTSLGTIYASWAIAASVFVSTWFPARTAMKIASPSTDLGWRLPEPDGDTLSFRLPFTFDWHDRIAVMAFFRRHFVDHGEGSSGAFFAGAPVLGIADRTDPLNGDGYIPTITTPIWLKPFDLGVSQELRISLPTDPETGEFAAKIVLTRRSGTLENWKRLNRVFVGLLRKHFLHWRAVAPDERAQMFEESKREMELGMHANGTANERE